MALNNPVLRRNIIAVICVLALTPLIAINLLHLDLRRTSRIPALYHSTNSTVSRLHYLIPATQATPNFCAVVAAGLANRYSIPTILGYKGEGEYDAKAAHIAKLRSISRYLHGEDGEYEDDLVIIVDGYDVRADLPAGAMIERYFELMNKADKRLTDLFGISIEEAHAKGLRQTVMWGTDKGCFPPRLKEPQCWLLPGSPMPRYRYGPNTDNGDLAFSDSKFLNSGTAIGPLGDVRKLINATLDLISDVWDPENKYRDSDQYYISKMYARQEYFRIRALHDGEFPLDVGDRELPREKISDDDETEFHMLVDFDASFTQTECHNARFMRNIHYNTSDHRAIVTEDSLEEGSSFKPYPIQMPSSVFLALTRLYESIADSLDFSSAKEWIRTLGIGTNVGTKNIWGFYHNTCDKSRFVDKYRNTWFFPYIKPMLKAAVQAINNEEPIHPRLINGRLWMAAQKYPSNDGMEYKYGGVYTDFEAERFIPFEDLCKGNLTLILEANSSA